MSSSGELDSEGKTRCRCYSGLEANACCFPSKPPISSIAGGFDRVHFQMQGYTPDGRILGVPSSLKLSVGLRNPFQIDQAVEEITTALAEAVLARRITDPHDIHEPRVKELSRLTENVSEVLYAFRYHQQQCIYRSEVIREAAKFATITGGTQISIEQNDNPLRFELESVIIRLRSTHDAVAHLLFSVLGQKPQTFGKLHANLINNPRKSALHADLAAVLKKHTRWIERARNIRDPLVHQGELAGYAGTRMSADGIKLSAMQEEGVSEFCIGAWQHLRGFFSDLSIAISRNPLVR